MPPSTGALLGPHEVQAARDAGGQDEVYTGGDTRLSRTIALDQVPTAFQELAVPGGAR